MSAIFEKVDRKEEDVMDVTVAADVKRDNSNKAEVVAWENLDIKGLPCEVISKIELIMNSGSVIKLKITHFKHKKDKDGNVVKYKGFNVVEDMFEDVFLLSSFKLEAKTEVKIKEEGFEYM